MTSFELYVFILCLIVFILLTAVFTGMLVMMTKQSLRLIDTGAEDERIYEEYIKAQELEKNKKKMPGWLSVAFTALFACIFTGIFAFTFAVQLTQDKQTGNIPTLRVVQSESMSAKYEKNEYLFKNNLNDQFSRFDIVITYQLPKEEDLKLYDIVVYEVDDTLLIHRIVGIEEPNEKHPDERHFLLQGDLVERADKFPVRYSQMKAIYRGEHIPFVGSFVSFLQSPAGYMCLLLVLTEMIASPLITKKIGKAEEVRLAYLLQQKQDAEKKAQEDEKAKEEQKALEAQKVLEAEQALAERKALEERLAAYIKKEEEQKALEAQKALEEAQSAQETQSAEEADVAEELAIYEEQAPEWVENTEEEQTAQEEETSAEEVSISDEVPVAEELFEEQNTQEEQTPATADKKMLRIASFHRKKKRVMRR